MNQVEKEGTDEAKTEQNQEGSAPSQEAGSGTPAPAPAPEPAKEKVEVERGVLESILDNQKRMEGTIETQTKTIEMLKSVADKGRLAKYDADHSEVLIRRANVGVWEGAVVLGWASAKDEVGFVHGVLKETQIIKLYLDAGKGKEPTTEEIEFLYFYRNVKRLFGDIIRESRSSTGETKTLKLEDGREFELDVRFINL